MRIVGYTRKEIINILQMSCHLSVIGEQLDIDVFEQKTQMPWTGRSYAGDTISPISNRKSTHSSLSITTSEASFADFHQQVLDTISFLKHYKSKLTYITHTPEIDFATINFGVNSNIDTEHLTQSFYLPQELVSLCGKLGISIEISVYKPDMQVTLEENRRKKSTM